MNSWLESQNTQQVKGLCSEWRRVDVEAWSIPPFPNLGWVWDPSVSHANLGTGENIPYHLTSGSSSVIWGFIHSSSQAPNTWYALGTVHSWNHRDVQNRHGPSHHSASPGQREEGTGTDVEMEPMTGVVKGSYIALEGSDVAGLGLGGSHGPRNKCSLMLAFLTL